MNENSDDLSGRLRASLAPHTAAPELDGDIVSGAANRRAPHLSRTPRQRMRIAGGATAALAVLTVGAIVITSQTAPAPLFTAAGNGQAHGFAANSEAATSDLRIANWVNYQYEAGENLSTDGSTGSVYQLTLDGTGSDRAATIASAFGLAGVAQKSSYFDESYPSYVVGVEDGTAPNVMVQWSGTGAWWYNDPAAYPVYECFDECTEPTQPAATSLAPSEAEARAQAHDLFAATGLAVDAADIRVTIDDWQTTASASLVVDGTATALDWSVSWSPTGAISWAYGQSVSLVKRGGYDTVSAHDSVARIADGRWFGSAGPEFQGGMSVFAAQNARGAVADDAPVDSVEPDVIPVDPTTPEDAPIDPALPDEAPVDPTLPEEAPIAPIEPETVVVTVTQATATLLLVWDSEGNAWLVPGYAMPHPDGWWNTVISLVDGIITLPEPMQIEPYQVDEGIAY